MGDAELPEVDPRDAIRIAITLRVRLAWGDDECLGYSTNLSMSGVYVEARDYLPVGQTVRVEFDLVEAVGLGRVEVDGVVARRIDDKEASARQLVAGVGIRFDEFVLGKFDLVRFLTPSRKTEDPPGVSPSLDSSERREATRVATGLPVTWGRANPSESSGYLANLSATGAFSIQTDEPCPAGTRIYLKFELPHSDGPGVRPVRAIANVVRTVDPGGDRPSGMGVHFDSATVDVETIRQFVEGRRAWERQLAQEGRENEADWVEPRASLPAGIERRRGGESAAPSRDLSMKSGKEPAPPEHPRKTTRAPKVLPASLLDWKWILLVLGGFWLALSGILSLMWVFSG